MLRYSMWFVWTACRGYRLCPWRSPLLKWRIETYSGIPAEQITFMVFWRFIWNERRELWNFLAWGAQMRRIEEQRRLRWNSSLTS